MAMTRAIVIGAGIAGLTTAVALSRTGVHCEIVERRTCPAGGGGLQLSPDATSVLQRLGLGTVLRDATRPRTRELRRWQDNSVIARTGLGSPDAPYCTMRRTTLVRALLAAVPGSVHFGRRCAGVIDHAGGVVARLDDGTALTGDIVVGADGLHSSVAAQLGTVPIRYSGHSVYRAVIPAGRAGRLAPSGVVVWLGPGQHCVAYPIDDGGSINLVFTVPAAVPPSAVREVETADVLRAYDNWHPAVRGLIALADRFDHHGLFDRAPLPAWHRGRVVLVGDAAHPMLPFVAQGAAQAIEDAAVLAGNPHDFARFEAERRPRVEPIAAAARDGAVEYHLPDGPAQRERDRRLAAGTRLASGALR
ncbi:hypothetical protein Ahu01nite_068880 [Winogradskya humida]|uniref:FAD-binding domain-containing protein n=2 Tax=Winogradskya humida TaxID=113566 RepID=A0ABQ3ZYV7_9ACTN|nr:hypothetical protein Ahu01nite_068880 [Actinoplanes humidus]